MTLLRATAWMRKLRFVHHPESNSLRAHYWILGVPVRRRTYWRFLYLCGLRQDSLGQPVKTFSELYH